MSIQITLDGRPVSTQAGANLVDVAAEHGVYIPTLCYLKGKPCLGTCRICSVSVNGRIAAACTVSVSDGMIVAVDEPALADMRKALIEMLFIEGNHNCPSCEKSGRCDLQAVGYDVGMLVPRFPYRFTPHQREVGAERIWLERDRCIFCQRCVDYIHDQHSGQKIFTIKGRGSNARIEIDKTLADQMSAEQVREAAELCPVGCIIEKGVGFNRPIGERKFEIKSVRQRALEDDV
ncbi:2Fe-2S iron-sulfur cluster-binding protein [Amphritea sp. 1_MG-2023]|uniref:2Fe-2S iron-sulfur cluster-binding protein n=1 Tax=Amphritea sp. 1_MG-2023 TaxID=3062670 RepID=UPI0026E24840|nr:2Fe-2S iron-sulfur cluster-binding protein [Amphritea sp. 1_MG-2023]MDO6563328.1 2Fe-2S iron-sulfur cluster-binding protein [Amphritea sp. 1_MG-2023]